MNIKEAFADWFDRYFVNSQTADSPYNFEDVKHAFESGYNFKKNNKE